MSVFLALLTGLFISTLTDPASSSSQIQPWMYLYIGVPVSLSALFYIASVYFQRRSRSHTLQSSLVGTILVGSAYIGIMLTFFYMWFTEIPISLIQYNFMQPFYIDHFYRMMILAPLFFSLSIFLGWLYGKKTIIITILLILVYVYMTGLGRFRLAYCSFVHPMVSSNPYGSLHVTKEEKEYLKYYGGSTINPALRAQIKCEKSFPLNFFINNSDKTYRW